jgi:hypothetical protein
MNLKKKTHVGWGDIQLEKDFQKVFEIAQLLGFAYQWKWLQIGEIHANNIIPLNILHQITL